MMYVPVTDEDKIFPKSRNLINPHSFPRVKNGFLVRLTMSNYLAKFTAETGSQKY